MTLTGDLTDDFGNATIDNPPWTSSASAVEAGGVLTVQCVASYGNVTTAGGLDFRSSRVGVEVLGVPAGGYVAIAPVADVTSTTSQLRQGSLTGPRMLLAGISVWGIEDPVIGGGGQPLGDQQYAARNSIAATLKSWGVTYVRMRLYADYWNSLSTSDQAAYVQKAVDWRNTLQAQGILTCFCLWDALDGTYSGSAWAANYNRSFALMTAVANAVGVGDPWTFWEPFNEPNNVSDDDWYTAMAATVTHFRTDIGYQGLLIIDPNVWAHTFDDTRFTNLENYDATLTASGRANIAFARHDYPNDYSGQTWNASTWTAATGGSSRRHIIIETEFGVYNGPGVDNPTWGSNAATFYASQMQTQTNFCGASPFIFGNWYDDNAITAADYVTTTTWGGYAKNNFLANANGTVPASSSGQAICQITASTGNTVETLVETRNGALNVVFRLQTGGVRGDVAIPYSTVDHRWWRMTESSGTITWATSADGLTWTTRRTAASTFSLASVSVGLLAGYWGAHFANQGSAVFDNFNLTPTGGGTSGPTWPQVTIEAGFGLFPTAESTYPIVNGDSATIAKSVGNWRGISNALLGVAWGVGPAPYRNALGVVAQGAGGMSAAVYSGAGAVIPGVSYTASVQVKAGAAGRSVSTAITWYDANGGSVFPSYGSSTITDSSAGWQTLTVSGTAPAGASQGALTATWTGCVLGEQHFLAGIAFDTTTSQWTDITRYVRKMTLGRSQRSYELARFEAGTATVVIDNTGGRFDPQNENSPYFPEVFPMVPIRVRAKWNGSTYPLWTGLVERWPQTWADPALSLPTITAVDMMAALSQGLLRSTYEQEVLLDGPVSFLPMTEPQTSTSAGNIIQSGAAPIVAGKFGTGGSAYGNSAVVYDGGSALALNPNASTTGSTTLADYVDLTGIPGIYPNLATGWTLELWAENNGGTYPPTNSPVFSHLVGGTTAKTGIQIIANRTGAHEVSLVVGGTRVYDSPGGYWGNGPMYLVVTYTASTGLIQFYINGSTVQYSGTPSLGTYPNVAVLGADWANTITPKNYYAGLVGMLAVYNYPLSGSRIDAHHIVGARGGSVESTGNRTGRILNYYGWPYSLRSIQLGNSTAGGAGGIGLSGLGGSSALSALQTVADAEGGQLYAAADGTITFEGRTFRNSQPFPINRWDPTGGLPYELGGLAFDYDPTHIYNQIALTRDGAATQSVTDKTSINLYFPRSYTSTLSLAYDDDVTGRANLLLSVYKDPAVRTSGFKFVPSANPSLFPVALAMDISDWQRVVHRPIGAPPISYDGYVDQLTHEITVEPGQQSWVVTAQLSPQITFYWQLAPTRTTATFGAGAGSTSLVLNALPDAGTNPAQSSWAKGVYQIVRSGAIVAAFTVTGVGPTGTSYSTFTVSTLALPVSISAGDTIASQMPVGLTDPTAFDARSVLGSTTYLGD